jgi:hypothetical protein
VFPEDGYVQIDPVSLTLRSGCEDALCQQCEKVSTISPEELALGKCRDDSIIIKGNLDQSAPANACPNALPCGPAVACETGSSGCIRIDVFSPGSHCGAAAGSPTGPDYSVTVLADGECRLDGSGRSYYKLEVAAMATPMATHHSELVGLIGCADSACSVGCSYRELAAATCSSPEWANGLQLFVNGDRDTRRLTMLSEVTAEMKETMADEMFSFELGADRPHFVNWFNQEFVLQGVTTQDDWEASWQPTWDYMFQLMMDTLPLATFEPLMIKMKATMESAMFARMTSALPSIDMNEFTELFNQVFEWQQGFDGQEGSWNAVWEASWQPTWHFVYDLMWEVLNKPPALVVCDRGYLGMVFISRDGTRDACSSFLASTDPTDHEACSCLSTLELDVVRVNGQCTLNEGERVTLFDRFQSCNILDHVAAQMKESMAEAMLERMKAAHPELDAAQFAETFEEVFEGQMVVQEGEWQALWEANWQPTYDFVWQLMWQNLTPPPALDQTEPIDTTAVDAPAGTAKELAQHLFG